MSARKIYNEGSEYSQEELVQQENFFKLCPGLEQFFDFKEIFDKWKPYQLILGGLEPVKPSMVSFLLHQYELCGATFGIILYIYNGEWELFTYEESGYAKGHLILGSNDFDNLGKILQGFSTSRYTFS